MTKTDKTPGSKDAHPNNAQPKNDTQGITTALKQAEKDIKNDTDLAKKPEASDDLDEGELARLEGNQ
jgi:hypothetical protein